METNLKFGALLLIGLLFAGAIVPLVAAQGLREENREARQRYAQARGDFAQMSGEYQDARENLIEARQRYGLRHQATVEAAGNFMDKAIGVTISHLERMRAFVESDWALEAADKERIISEIDVEIAWLEAKQAEVEGATREELVEIGKTVQDRWRNQIRVNLKDYTGQILNARAQWLLEEADKAIVVAEQETERARNAGKDVTEAEALIEDAKAKRDLAEAEYNKAKNSFGQINSLQDADRLFREGYAFIKEGNRYILDAYQDLKRINSELRN
ncbi:hypothetical protein CO038_02195 [Candidatus Pacearchaeota archaeon CG_4_9_14_0_2_um_filter_39_13]|nr:hypothetical protein [Candidatus Pacearchaeota archaeon]OIO43907.1 MAG: hypothetical protein AUJ64_01250 [Candidatus Pacearchaeota archaeon CG1_02_39_14]PJC44756.1 MAG: hypothetical protein CO038_02195 [Candidatus Pacearchaeota archaeon CG_4_9_14_0_2_um_filter_39_13]